MSTRVLAGKTQGRDWCSSEKILSRNWSFEREIHNWPENPHESNKINERSRWWEPVRIEEEDEANEHLLEMEEERKEKTVKVISSV